MEPPVHLHLGKGIICCHSGVETPHPAVQMPLWTVDPGAPRQWDASPGEGFCCRWRAIKKCIPGDRANDLVWLLWLTYSTACRRSLYGQYEERIYTSAPVQIYTSACMRSQHLTLCGVLSNHVIGDIKTEDTGMILYEWVTWWVDSRMAWGSPVSLCVRQPTKMRVWGKKDFGLG